MSSSPSVTQPAKPARSSKTTKSSRDALLVTCLVLSVIAIAALHKYAATVAVLFIVVGGFLLFSKRIHAKTKMVAAALALICVLGVNAVEGVPERREEARQQEVARQQAARVAAENEKREEAFKAMSPSEHLEKVKVLRTSNIEPAAVAEALKHLNAIPPGTPEAAEAVRIRTQFDHARQQQAESALKKLVNTKPLTDPDAATMMQQVSTLQAMGVTKDPAIAKLVAKAQDRNDWVQLRSKKDVEAIAVCRTAIKRRLKAPDEVDWEGEEAGYDPKEDWVMNVEQQADAMNSFGAKLRTTFFCRAVCTKQADEWGFNCIATRVTEH